MHISKSTVSLFGAVFSTLTIGLAGVSVANAQTTTPPAGDKASYFVLDFNDGTATPTTGFQLNYPTAQTGSASDLIQTLAQPQYSTGLQPTSTYFSGLGYYYTAFQYGAHSAALTGDYSYGWTLYTSANGQSWVAASLGASSTNISGSSPWIAFSYGPTGFTTSGNPVAPPSAATLGTFVTVTGALAPEPGTFALIGVTILAGVPLLRRRL